MTEIQNIYKYDQVNITARLQEVCPDNQRPGKPRSRGFDDDDDDDDDGGGDGDGIDILLKPCKKP